MKTIPFKAVAVDMDGTFLNQNSSYNKNEFIEVMRILQKNDVYFVIATGNELIRTRHDLGNFADQCAYVCENGSLVVIDNKIIFQDPISLSVKNSALELLQNKYSQVEIVLSGASQAYVLKTASDEFKQVIDRCYAKVNRVDDLLAIKDPIFKITLNCSEELVEKIIAKFNQNSDKIRGVTGGGPWMDLIQPTANKGHGLKILLDYLKINPKQLIAFGDGNNDLEMLKLAECSYAMANGSSKAKQVAKFIAPKNTENGVFQILERYLKVYE